MSERTIAIVEDDAGMREALGRMLRAAGFEARGYSSAEEFLQDDAADPGCLVLDIQLPGASGLDLLRRLLKEGQARPVIFITAHDTASARLAAAGLGAVAFLTKPFEGRQLVAAVHGALDN
jgi:FixJ family two-component response regulator